MNSIDLQAIKDAEESGDHAQAVTLSDVYVIANPGQFTDNADMTIEACVTAVDVFRAAGMDDNQWQMSAWIYHHFDFQNIGGTYQPQIRVTGE